MRDVDRVIAFIRAQKDISPIEQQVMVNRLSFAPTEGEIALARVEVDGREPAGAR